MHDLGVTASMFNGYHCSLCRIAWQSSSLDVTELSFRRNVLNFETPKDRFTPYLSLVYFPFPARCRQTCFDWLMDRSVMFNIGDSRRLLMVRNFGFGLQFCCSHRDCVSLHHSDKHFQSPGESIFVAVLGPHM